MSEYSKTVLLHQESSVQCCKSAGDHRPLLPSLVDAFSPFVCIDSKEFSSSAELNVYKLELMP